MTGRACPLCGEFRCGCDAAGAEGVSWSGEVADDIVTRVVRGFREAIDAVTELEEADDE